MSLTKRQEKQLDKIVKLIETFREQASKRKDRPQKEAKSTRKRRSAADAAKLKKEIRAARKKGVSAAELAKKHGVSLAYVYMSK